MSNSDFAEDGRSIRVLDYLAYVPTLHFGMTEQEFAQYSSTREPRSVLLAMLRDELGWHVSIHTLSLTESRRCQLPPLNIPIHFHKVSGGSVVRVLKPFEPARRRFLRFLASVRFWRELVKTKPQLFIFRGNLYSMFSHVLGRYLDAKGIPYIFEEHSIRIVVDRSCRRFAHRAKKVIVLTDETAAAYVRGYGLAKENVVVVSNGVLTDRFIPARDRANQEFPRLAFAGHQTHAKGFDIALQCLAAVRKRWPKAQLEVAGVPLPNSQSFAETALSALSPEDRSAVVLHGWLNTDELISLYHRADILLFPSRAGNDGHEGEPRVVLEAMSCGLPVAAIDGSGGHCSIIARSGTGRLAETSSGYCEAVVDYLSEPRRVSEDRDQVRNFVAKTYAISKVYETYKACCLEAINGDERRGNPV